MADLTLYGRRIETLFDLLGDAEDDITYSVGWGLSQSEDLTRALLREIFGATEQGEVTAVRLQESEPGTGRTDIEIETEFLRLVIEAKRGWQLPHRDQLQLYASRLNSHDSRHKRIAVVAEAAPHFPPVAALPPSLDGVPVTYLPWSRVAALVHATARASGRAQHGRLLHDLHRYLRSLMTMQNTTSNLVYVVVLNDEPLDWSDLTFKQIVCERLRYFHPVGGGPGGWPKTPPNYLGFRFGGRLQRIHHVESYEVITRPHKYIPEIHEDEDWSDNPHFLYVLGPAMEPAREIRSGNLFRNGRVWCSLDLLLTASSISEARDLTRQRHEQAGIPYP
jgi:hypothetical protein